MYQDKVAEISWERYIHSAIKQKWQEKIKEREKQQRKKTLKPLSLKILLWEWRQQINSLSQNGEYHNKGIETAMKTQKKNISTSLAREVGPQGRLLRGGNISTERAGISREETLELRLALKLSTVTYYLLILAKLSNFSKFHSSHL